MVMRKLLLPLNQTQKIRYERAKERLQSLSSTTDSVIVADSIPVNHEDALRDTELPKSTVSCWRRSVELWFAWTSSSMYAPCEPGGTSLRFGDIVVGRVIEVEFCNGDLGFEIRLREISNKGFNHIAQSLNKSFLFTLLKTVGEWSSTLLKME